MSFSMEDLLGHLITNNVDPNDQVYNYLCTTNVRRLKDWLQRLDRVRAYKATSKEDRGRKSALTGKVFESLVRCLFDGCHAMTCLNNVRSTSSEIDFLIQIQPMANALPFLHSVGTHLIGEAKCILKGFKKEWIDELRGIMETHNTKRSVLFTAVPSKKLSREPKMAIALHAATGNLIVPFGLRQIDKVLKGENFLRVLGLQTLQASNHLSTLEV